MPDRDLLGETVQRSLGTLSRLRTSMATKIPFGPLRENLTNEEARLQLQNLDPTTKQKFMQNMSPDEWQALMERLYQHGG